MGREDEALKKYKDVTDHKQLKKKQEKSTHPSKFQTSKSEPELPSNKQRKNAEFSRSHADYLKRNLYIKSALDKESCLLRFQAKKLSIRNYIPKIINQELNMGMWIWFLFVCRDKVKMATILATIASMASAATNPLTIAGLVPVFAAGLAFLRYISVDPESHPIDVRRVRIKFFFSISLRNKLKIFSTWIIFKLHKNHANILHRNYS